jgi:hypothetical protein
MRYFVNVSDLTAYERDRVAYRCSNIFDLEIQIDFDSIQPMNPFHRSEHLDDVFIGDGITVVVFILLRQLLELEKDGFFFQFIVFQPAVVFYSFDSVAAVAELDFFEVGEPM